jgi:hypothetical protein
VRGRIVLDPGLLLVPESPITKQPTDPRKGSPLKGKIMHDRVKAAINAAAKELTELNGEPTICVDIGLKCIVAQVPLSFIEALLDVSTPTVYRWVTGTNNPNNKAIRRKLVRLRETLELALNAGAVPASKFEPAILLPYWKQTKHLT